MSAAPTLTTTSPGSRVRRWAVELLPPFVVALLVLPFVISGGRAWPWVPATIDLDVYVLAVRDMLAGGNIYTTQSPGYGLFFIYPPVAAVLMTPLAFGPYALWQVLWTLAGVAAQQSVLRRCGAPRGWRLALLGVVVVLAVEPIRTTLGYGQVNTFLMFLVVADLLPDAEGERRWWPRGSLIGLAAAIKLTPALFVLLLLALGRRRPALVAIASFLAFTVVGAIAQPARTVEFFGGLAMGDTRTAGPIYVGNQSLLGVVARLLGDSRPLTLAGLALAGVVALLSVVVARHWWRAGHPVFAVALVGMATCLASPLSWTHHHVWVVVLAMALLTAWRDGRMPRWLLAVGGFWVLWVSICLPLAALPYGQDAERSYGPLQDLVGSLGPLTGLVLLVVLAVRQLRVSRSAAAAAPVGSR
ncbi:glycosyltransferase 87 family protein [Desertihabitans aurantiacus]|uniref:glycosyltransferase 87 family protein n=1 Tax=Desertihabitans aurantiacus TaxID=2282477 RepID=UPI000DF75682|nr:glycosyltransferase 87 family protein [Desertihabitans aurantiacus]